MTFKTFNKAIDMVIENYGLSEDDAIDLVCRVTDILDVHPSETEEEMRKLFAIHIFGEA